MKHDLKEADLPLLQRFYDMANCADASYAMLQYIEENDEAEDLLDDLFNLVRKPPSRWIYADGIKRGYKLERDIEALGKKQGQPTAYALGIEAR